MKQQNKLRQLRLADRMWPYVLTLSQKRPKNDFKIFMCEHWSVRDVMQKNSMLLKSTHLWVLIGKKQLHNPVSDEFQV